MRKIFPPNELARDERFVRTKIEDRVFDPRNAYAENRGFRADDWMLHGHESVSAADHRALTTGWFVSPAGRLVASVSQETALLPVAGPQPETPVPAACTRT